MENNQYQATLSLARGGTALSSSVPTRSNGSFCSATSEKVGSFFQKIKAVADLRKMKAAKEADFNLMKGPCSPQPLDSVVQRLPLRQRPC
jgi:hypothetical protein